MSGIHIGSSTYHIPRTILDGAGSFDGRDWTNIQHIVRSTFRSLSDVIKLQGEALRKLEDSSDVLRRDTATAQYKAEHSIQELDRALDTKASLDQVVSMHREVVEQVQQVSSALRGKADDVAIRAMISDGLSTIEARVMADVQAQVRAAVEPLAESTEALKRTMARLASRVEKDGEMTANALRSIGSTFDSMEAAINGLKERAAHAENAIPKLEAVVSSLGKRCERAESLEGAVAALQSRVQHLDRHVEATSALKEAVEALAVSLDSKADRRELKKATDSVEALAASLDAKADRRELEAAADSVESLAESLDSKADRRELKKATDSVEALAASLDAKADRRELKAAADSFDGVRRTVERDLGALDSLRGELKGLRSELSHRPTTEEVCSLLDTKADIADINASLAEVSKEMESRVSHKEFEKTLVQQHAVNSNICAEMCTGRWLWKSGKVKSNGAIPWNLESINTDPSNFQWEKGGVSIMTVVPGLYEVTFGFFSRKKPQVQLLVDGQPVLVCTNSSSLSLGAKLSKPHPAGTVTGLTLNDYLALPPKAKVSLIYQGDETGEGFFQLKKL